MIANDRELQVALQRIAWFQQQVTHLRASMDNSANYRAAASGFLAEIDRMQLEVREYLGTFPSEHERAEGAGAPAGIDGVAAMV